MVSRRALQILEQIGCPLDPSLEAVNRSWITLSLREKVFDDLVEEAERRHGEPFAMELERLGLDASHNRVVMIDQSGRKRGSSALVIIPIVIQTDSEISGIDDYLTLPSPEAFARAVRQCGWAADHQHVGFCDQLLRYSDLIELPTQQIFDIHDSLIASAQSGAHFELERREEICGYRVGGRSVVLRFAVGTIFVEDPAGVELSSPPNVAIAQRQLAHHIHLQLWSDTVINQFVSAFSPLPIKAATAVGETEIMGAALQALAFSIRREDARVLAIAVTPDAARNRLLVRVTWTRERDGDWLDEPQTATLPIPAMTAADLQHAAEDVMDYLDSLDMTPGAEPPSPGAKAVSAANATPKILH